VSWDLPPGVTVDMIPGNRPEDEEWEEFNDWLVDVSNKYGLSIEQFKEIFLKGIEESK